MSKDVENDSLAVENDSLGVIVSKKNISKIASGTKFCKEEYFLVADAKFGYILRFQEQKRYFPLQKYSSL